MDHLAIMKKSWGLVPKILAGEKIIESRWYKNKAAPWGKVQPGDKIYFKNTGEPVTVRGEIGKVLQFDKLTPDKVRAILHKYGGDDGIKPDQLENYWRLFKNKRFCLLMYVEKPEKIEPFDIDKTGFGAMAAWICVEDINKIKTG